jgi:phosphoglycolate phosphatase
MSSIPAYAQFDLIVFDWDGTLFDSTALITRCIQAASADVGAEVPTREQASYVIGMGLSEALRYAVPGLAPDRHAELVQRYRHHYMARQHELTLFDGVLELLHTLKGRSHRLAVATGKSRRGLDDVLARVEMHGVFDATRTADETASKPHPRMLLELMDELGASPTRTLMIGDTTHDLQLAINAGAASLGVSYGAHDHREFAPLRPKAVVHSVQELHDWLVKHA